MTRAQARLAVIGSTLALLGGASAPARAADGQAYAAALNYATPAVLVAQGDGLRFNNLDSLAQHDLVSDQPGQFNSPLITGGQSASVQGVVKLKPGTYNFHCSIHPWMHGALTVLPAGGAPGPPTPPSGPPSPTQPPNPVNLMPRVPASPLGADQWPFYGRDLANSRDGGFSEPSYNELPTLGPVWSFESTHGDFTGTPVVASGTLVAAAGGGYVYALNAATGRLRWSRHLNGPINGSAAITHGRVFVPLANPGRPQLAALALASGRVLWQKVIDSQKDSDVYGSPVVWNASSATPRRRRARSGRRVGHRRRRAARRLRHENATRGDTVYIGISALYGELNDPRVRVRGNVVALNARNGAIRWKSYMVPPGHDGGAVWSTPAVDTATGRLFVGTGNAYHPPAAGTTDSIVALNAHSGRILGHLQATAGDVWNAAGDTAGGPDYDFGASPNLFIGTRGEHLVGDGQKSGAYWALDRRSLRPVWTAQIGPGTSVVGGIVGSTASDGERIYGPNTTAGEIWALNDNGTPAWVSSDAGPLQFSAVSAANGVVYTTDMSGTLTAREATTGAVLAKLPLGAPSWGGVALAGGSVFAVTGTEGSNGWVVAYRPGQ